MADHSTSDDIHLSPEPTGEGASGGDVSSNQDSQPFLMPFTTPDQALQAHINGLTMSTDFMCRDLPGVQIHQSNQDALDNVIHNQRNSPGTVNWEDFKPLLEREVIAALKKRGLEFPNQYQSQFLRVAGEEGFYSESEKEMISDCELSAGCKAIVFSGPAKIGKSEVLNALIISLALQANDKVRSEQAVLTKTKEKAGHRFRMDTSDPVVMVVCPTKLSAQFTYNALKNLFELMDSDVKLNIVIQHRGVEFLKKGGKKNRMPVVDILVTTAGRGADLLGKRDGITLTHLRLCVVKSSPFMMPNTLANMEKAKLDPSNRKMWDEEFSHLACLVNFLKARTQNSHRLPMHLVLEGHDMNKQQTVAVFQGLVDDFGGDSNPVLIGSDMNLSNLVGSGVAFRCVHNENLLSDRGEFIQFAKNVYHLGIKGLIGDDDRQPSKSRRLMDESLLHEIAVHLMRDLESGRNLDSAVIVVCPKAWVCDRIVALINNGFANENYAGQWHSNHGIESEKLQSASMLRWTLAQQGKRVICTTVTHAMVDVDFPRSPTIILYDVASSVEVTDPSKNLGAMRVIEGLVSVAHNAGGTGRIVSLTDHEKDDHKVFNHAIAKYLLTYRTQADFDALPDFVKDTFNEENQNVGDLVNETLVRGAVHLTDLLPFN